MKHTILFTRYASAVLIAAYLLPLSTLAYAEPNAGTVLRNSQQIERKLPERQAPDVTVEKEIKPPMINNAGFKVFVKSYQISGQDLYSKEELTRLLSGYTDKEVNMAGLQEAANAVAEFFREQGYFAAQAYLPVQDITDGQVEIRVLVGRCGDIILRNKSQIPDAVLRRQLAHIKTGSYIHRGIMERAALLVGDLPNVSAKITLAPGKNPGTADVIVEARQKAADWQGSLSANNWGSRLTGTLEPSLNLLYNNPFHQGDSLSGSLGRTNLGEDTGSIGYHLALGEGSFLNVGYSKVYYELGKEMAPLDAYGAAYTKHADWTYALKRSRLSNLSLQVGYDHKSLQDYVGHYGSATSKWSHMLSLGLSGDSIDEKWGGGSNSYSFLWYTGSMGGSTNSSGTQLATGNWQKFTYSAMRQQYISERLALFGAVSGQLASHNLDSSEKFSLGGANGVRAYPTSEASGDEAWLATAELRYSLPETKNGSTWQLIAFYDTGSSQLEKHQVTPGENRRTLSGAGIGVNYFMPGSYAVKLSYAWKVGSEAAQAETDKQGRLWLQGIRYF